MRGRKDLAWVDRRGVAHGLRSYDRGGPNHVRSWTTWCGIGINGAFHELHRLPTTCMTCLVRHEP
jgi:hypothetical protein